MPLWVGILVLAREAALSVVTLVLAAAGARRIDVQWVGKAGTLALMFAFPLFVLVNEMSPSGGRDVIELITWCFTIGGLVLSYYAGARYIPMARTKPARTWSILFGFLILKHFGLAERWKYKKPPKFSRKR